MKSEKFLNLGFFLNGVVPNRQTRNNVIQMYNKRQTVRRGEIFWGNSEFRTGDKIC